MRLFFKFSLKGVIGKILDTDTGCPKACFCLLGKL